MNAIVSVTRDWAIGNKGQLLVRNRDDMRFFRDQTMGGTVVCGRTTFQSFPGGALKGRRNVVLSRSEDYAPAGAEVVKSTQEALDAVATDAPDRVWLIGGDRVYHELLDACDTAYVTYNDVTLEADAFFPNLDDDPAWELAEVLGEGVTQQGIAYEFRRYQRVNGEVRRSV